MEEVIIHPKYLYRPDDGQRYTLQKNDKYTMDSSEMAKPHEYSYKILKFYKFVDSLDKCDTLKKKCEHAFRCLGDGAYICRKCGDELCI